MTDKQKQIEEMTKVIDNVQTYGTKWYPDKYEPFESRIENDDIASELINAGYRKISEGSVVLTKEEHEKLLALKDDYVKGYEAGVDEGWDNAKEETAKEVLEKVWDKTTAKEVGMRWLLLKIAEEYDVTLDRELKKYGGTNKPV